MEMATDDHPGIICSEDGCISACFDECSACSQRFCEEHASFGSHICVTHKDSVGLRNGDISDDEIDIQQVENSADNVKSQLQNTMNDPLEHAATTSQEEVETSIGTMVVCRTVDGIDLLVPHKPGGSAQSADSAAVIKYSGVRFHSLVFVFGDKCILISGESEDTDSQRVFLAATAVGDTGKKVICHYWQMKYAADRTLGENVRSLDQCERWPVGLAMASMTFVETATREFQITCAAFGTEYFSASSVSACILSCINNLF
jgi:hypothetical protein